MAGNIKLGVMSGNQAGRNGNEISKAFYCDAREKNHSSSVERTEIAQLFDEKTKIGMLSTRS